MTVLCDYCLKPAELVDGRSIYPHRPDLSLKMFWRCATDDAWIGTHPGTKRPMGRLANLKLRQAKIAAHAWFDRRWNSVPNKSARALARRREYRWLAEQLGIQPAACHIGLLGLEDCLRIIEACRRDDSGAS